MNRLRDQQTKVTSKSKSYYKYIKYPEIPLDVNDIYIITKDGDRLDLIANQYYGDPDLWWVITKANPNKISRDSFFMSKGIQIRIPSTLENIINEYENINKSTF
jgi:phage tail protein X